MEANKINYEQVLKYVGHHRPSKKDIQWKGLQLSIRTYLTLDEEYQFLSYVQNTCLTDGAYNYSFNLAYKIVLIKFFTNIEMPGDIKLIHKLVYQTDIIDVIKNNAPEQIADLLSTSKQIIGV